MSQKLVSKLFENNIISVNVERPYLYASGLRGPIYCDNRKILGNPNLRDLFARELVEKISSLDVDELIIGAMATGAIGLGALVADRLNKPLVYIRSKGKVHGTGNLIEGDSGIGLNVVLIEDLINQGGSVEKGASEVRENSRLNLSAIVCLIDYKFQASREKLTGLNVPVLSLVSFSDILEYLGNINIELADQVNLWHQDPLDWSTNFS